MHVNEYLHKCPHHKIHPGKQHCKGAHTKRNIQISAVPHADAPTPHRPGQSGLMIRNTGTAESLKLIKEVGDNSCPSNRELWVRIHGGWVSLWTRVRMFLLGHHNNLPTLRWGCVAWLGESEMAVCVFKWSTQTRASTLAILKVWNKTTAPLPHQTQNTVSV